MRGRLCRIAFATVIGAVTLSGCAQMTRHSNTMVFGTNTSFGIKVGADATATPGITVGYSRQEAVIMPLVANTGGTPDGLLPCPVGPDGKLPIECLLVGMNGSTHGDMRDAYSVFASFGTKFGANAGTPQASGQIAQYFATGVAAQKLAESGAATIALGSAAAASSAGTSERASAVQLSRSQVASQIRGAGDLTAFLQKLDGAARSDTDFQEACDKVTDKEQCAGVVEKGGLPSGLSVKDWAAAASVKP
jgi:hypothetical protein